jgi:hypothetical protein
MNGYIYTMAAGADPGYGWTLNDPIFGKVPTLGACVPNIRRVVLPGDYIFVVSGRIPNVQQFVVGGFEVSEKINALAAYKRFPENRLRLNSVDQVEGNIISNSKGEHHELDDHDNFDKRIENYIVGRNPVNLTSKSEFDAAREDTVDTLGRVFGRKGQRVFDIIGRHRKMDDSQVKKLVEWLESIKS